MRWIRTDPRARTPRCTPRTPTPTRGYAARCGDWFGAGGRGERTRLAHAAQKHLGRERAGLARTHARARGGERRGRRAEARAGGARLGSGGGWDLSTTARVRAARRLLGDPRRDVVVHDGNRDARPAPRSARRRSGLCRGDARERRVETISNAPPRRKPSAAGESSAKSENCRRAARQLPHRPRCASPSRLGALRPRGEPRTRSDPPWV